MSKIKSGLRIQEKTFKTIDGRLAIAKEFKVIKNKLVEAIGGDPSPQQLVLLDRIVFLLYRVTIFEHRILSGEDLSGDVQTYYLAWCNTLRRTLETLGLERRARDITLEALLKNEKE